MFLKFFSLSHNPFRTRASGTEVFAGPQLAAVTTGIQRSLVERDAVCVVMGPVGAGKTVAVSQGLSQLVAKHVVVKIGRVRLGRDEILEELISGLGGDDTLTSTPRRIAELGRLLQTHEDQESRVIVAVEDAVRLGLEGLIELEALTSPDTGDSSGANLILMGSPDLHELLDASELARLKQRVSGRQTVAAFSLGETQGYLTARLRAAGGSAETLFPGDAVIALHEHSGGIARVINRLGGAVLRAAADAGQLKVTAALVEGVAEGRPIDRRAEEGAMDTAATAEPDTNAEAMPPAPGDDTPAASDDVDAEDVAVAAPTASTSESMDSDGDLAITDDDIPELIDDTLPEFAALKLPEGDRTTADLVAELRDKTDGTQPSLPVLTPDTSDTYEAPPVSEGAPPTPGPIAAEPATVDAAPRLESRLPQDAPSSLPDLATELPSMSADVPAPTFVSEPTPNLTESPPREAAAAIPDPTPKGDILSDGIKQRAEPAATPVENAMEVQGIESIDPAPPVSIPEEPQESLVLAAESRDNDVAPTPVDAPMSEPAANRPAAAPLADNEADTADTQTIKALDSALRPDTALLAALGRPKVPDNAGAPENDETSPEAPEADASESLPTLSASMRLEPETIAPPAAAAPSPEPLVDSKPLELLPEPNASAAPLTAAPAAPAAPARDVPEITLEDSIRDQQKAAQARLDAEAAKREAAAQAEAEKLKPSAAEQAAAAERAAENERLAAMPSIMDQLDDNAELPSSNDADEKDDERVKLKELADRLGGATSLEEVDDVAAETLFGVEFSQLASTVTAKALEGPSASEETSELKLALEPEPEADLISAPTASEAPPASPPPSAVNQTGANSTNAATAANGANEPTPPQRPEPGSLPDIESSAARRLEMVRSLNGTTGPVVPPPNLAEEIVLGEAAPTPLNDGPSPDPIEDQFGTSMTANLKALSMQNVQEMQQAEEEKEQKKRGFLSRFKRS